MLSKETCEVCWRRHCNPARLDYDGSDKAMLYHWWEHDSSVVCPAGVASDPVRRTFSVNGEPPEHCPYAAEHVVSQEC